MPGSAAPRTPTNTRAHAARSCACQGRAAPPLSPAREPCLPPSARRFVVTTSRCSRSPALTMPATALPRQQGSGRPAAGHRRPLRLRAALGRLRAPAWLMLRGVSAAGRHERPVDVGLYSSYVTGTSQAGLRNTCAASRRSRGDETGHLLRWPAEDGGRVCARRGGLADTGGAGGQAELACRLLSPLRLGPFEAAS